jgi:impB/mucB/samB family C-terminal domain
MSAEAVVEKMRAEVTAVTGGLTVSAGVACSRTIAKIAADFNKPNGSYFVPSSRVAVLEFCSGLNIRKIPGIGKVSESMLTRGFGIEKVGDIWDHLPALHFALSDSTFRFLVSNALGVAGSSDDYDAGSRQRKSVSRERTFRPLGDAAALREMVSGICSRVSEDIASLEGIDGGRVVTLKIKTSDFRVRSRSKTVWNVVSSKEDLQRIALEALENELPLEARLLGVRVHDLAGSLYDAAKVNVNPGQARISSFFGNAGGKRFRVQNAGTEEDPLLRVEQDLLPDLDDDDIPPCPTSQRGQDSNRQASKRDGGKEARMTCPVCGRATFDDLGCLNRHVDECLTEVELRGRSRKKRKKQYAMDAFLK